MTEFGGQRVRRVRPHTVNLGGKHDVLVVCVCVVRGESGELEGRKGREEEREERRERKKACMNALWEWPAFIRWVDPTPVFFVSLSSPSPHPLLLCLCPMYPGPKFNLRSLHRVSVSVVTVSFAPLASHACSFTLDLVGKLLLPLAYHVFFVLH